AVQLSHQLLGASFEYLEKFDEAVTEYLKMIPDCEGKDSVASSILEAYAKTGMKGFWRRFTDFLDQLFEQRTIKPVFIAGVYARLGEWDAAFDWLEKAFGDRNAALSHIQVDPRLKSLHDDPRFSGLLRRMGLSFGVR